MTVGARFTVDDRRLGTAEEVWTAAGRLADLAPLLLPDADGLVVVAPHPDDEVFGAGGLLSALCTGGSSITVLAVTDGEGSHPEAAAVTPDDLRVRRAAEITQALRRLTGAEVPRRRLGLPDGKVSAHVADLGQLIAESLRPSTLCLAPWSGDGHPDHDATGRAAMWACDQTGAHLLSYLVWTWHWADPREPSVPWDRARRWGLSSQQRARKWWAIDSFSSQTAALGDGPGDGPVLPRTILARWCRPFEIYLQ